MKKILIVITVIKIKTQWETKIQSLYWQKNKLSDNPECWLIPSLFFKDLFIDWLIAMLGLRFCARAFSSCGKRGPLFITVRGPLTIVASPVAEHRLQTRRLSSCGSRAQLLRGMWDLPRRGLEPVSPALAGRFSTTAPPGKPASLNRLSQWPVDVSVCQPYCWTWASWCQRLGFICLYGPPPSALTLIPRGACPQHIALTGCWMLQVWIKAVLYF